MPCVHIGFRVSISYHIFSVHLCVSLARRQGAVHCLGWAPPTLVPISPSRAEGADPWWSGGEERGVSSEAGLLSRIVGIPEQSFAMIRAFGLFFSLLFLNMVPLSPCGC